MFEETIFKMFQEVLLWWIMAAVVFSCLWAFFFWRSDADEPLPDVEDEDEYDYLRGATILCIAETWFNLSRHEYLWYGRVLSVEPNYDETAMQIRVQVLHEGYRDDTRVGNCPDQTIWVNDHRLVELHPGVFLFAKGR